MASLKRRFHSLWTVLTKSEVCTFLQFLTKDEILEKYEREIQPQKFKTLYKLNF